MRLLLTARIFGPVGQELPPPFELLGMRASIGRSPTSDWTLPDPNGVISGQHCIILKKGGSYELQDISTNGTLVNGCAILPGVSYQLSNGDVLGIGDILIDVRLENLPGAKLPSAWRGAAETKSSAITSGWDRQPPPSTNGGDTRGVAPEQSRGWGKPSGSDQPPNPAPTVDTRGGPSIYPAITHGRVGYKDRSECAPTEKLLHDLVAGIMTMFQTSKRARSEIGVAPRAGCEESGNPLRTGGNADAAVAALLAPDSPHSMSAEQAIAEAFAELEMHRRATLRAMQGALRVTLERYSPDAIRSLAGTGSLTLLRRSNADEAALWKCYEQAFGGLMGGYEGGFVEIFAREFKRAYEEQ